MNFQVKWYAQFDDSSLGVNMDEHLNLPPSLVVA